MDDPGGKASASVAFRSPSTEQCREEALYQYTLLERLRRQTAIEDAIFLGLGFEAHPLVFPPNLDTQVLVESLPLFAYDTFLEVGSGSGAVSVFAARSGARGLAVDLNEAAVENTRANLRLHGLAEQVEVRHGDLFEGIEGCFDLVIANLPFMKDRAEDIVARAIFDETLDTWRRFFEGVGERLGPAGSILTVLPNFCAFREILDLADTHGFRWEHLRSVHEEWMEFASFRLSPGRSQDTASERAL